MTREEFLRQLPELAKNYKASNEVIHRIGEVSLLMIIGPSGVGKTSIIKDLDIPYVVADTTRQPRTGEKNGTDYYFRMDYDQIIEEIRNKQFVQMAIGPTGDFYATRPQSYPEKGPAVYAVVADVVPIFRELGFKQTIGAFITPPSHEEWMERINSHHLTAEQLNGRMAEAQRSLNFALNDEQMHFVLNDDLEKAVKQTEDIVNGKIDHDRERTAQESAKQILNAIK